MKAKIDPTAALSVPVLKIEPLRIRLIGTSPLVTHAWSKKAKEMMLAKQKKEAREKPKARDPWMDFCEALYWLNPSMPEKPTQEDIDKATFGFPTIGVKASAVSACASVADLTKVFTRTAFHIDGEYLPISGSIPKMRDDMVRLSGPGGVADIRFRPSFFPWSIDATVKYNAAVISPAQIKYLFDVAGFGVGLGEHRPERSGQNGMFTTEIIEAG